tara:strand:+ start:2392 stop:2727 length:336 start_codon:yes stop_codon:yes gene_type:complete
MSQQAVAATSYTDDSRYRPAMAEQLKQVGLRLPPSLLELIDKAAADSHQDRSNWIRSACVQALTGPNASRNPQLVDEVEVVDERAREVVKDLLRRMDQVEQKLAIKPDPFI